MKEKLLAKLVAISSQYYPPSDLGLPGTETSNIKDTTYSILTDVLLPVAGIIAVLFIIIGGYQYITGIQSGKDDKKTSAGKKTLTNAIIGLVIIILSYTIVVAIFDSLVTKVK